MRGCVGRGIARRERIRGCIGRDKGGRECWRIARRERRRIGRCKKRRFQLERADVAVCALRAHNAALVCQQAGIIVPRIDGRRTRQQGHGPGGAAVIRQRGQHRVAAEGRAATAVLDQVVVVGVNATAICTIAAGAAVGNDRIGQQ